MDAVPGYTPMSTEEFRKAMVELGGTEDTLGAYVKGFNRWADSTFSGELQRKPQPNDPNVYSVRIPDSRYAIRNCDGGMGGYGQFFLDFFDLERRVSVNLPAGHTLYPATAPAPQDAGPGYPPVGNSMPLNATSFGWGEIRSWERNQNMHAFPEGEERCSIPEGAYISLQRTGHPDFLFQMPTRRTVVAAQPQMGPLC